MCFGPIWRRDTTAKISSKFGALESRQKTGKQLMKQELSKHGTAGQFQVPVPSSGQLAPGFGARVAAVLGKIGSRKDAAAALDVSDDTLLRYVSEATIPRLDTAVLMCSLAAVSLDWLVGGTDDCAASAALAPAVADEPARYMSHGQPDPGPLKEAILMVIGDAAPAGAAEGVIAAYRLLTGASCSADDIRSVIASAKAR